MLFQMEGAREVIANGHREMVANLSLSYGCATISVTAWNMAAEATLAVGQRLNVIEGKTEYSTCKRLLTVNVNDPIQFVVSIQS